jgi:polysaccharide pyruvyl transferase WcaK-like protein
MKNSRKNKRIALFGIFGIQNLGNECTLEAMLYNVRRLYPEMDIYGICYEPEDTYKRHALPAVPISSVKNPAPKIRTGGRRWFAKPIRMLFYRLPAELLDWIRAIRELWGTRLMMMTGTGMLTDYSTSCLGYPYDVLKWAVAAKLVGCRIRFIGVGVGPIYDRLSRNFIKIALRLADYRSFRDELSKSRIQNLGFHALNDPVVPDLAFSMPQHTSHSECTEKCNPTVGLGLLRHVDAHVSEEKDRITAYQKYLAIMCQFATWLLDQGYKIRILQGDTRHDGIVRRDFRNEMERRGIQYETSGIVDEDIVSVEDLLRQLFQVDIVVSSRYHNLILALLLNKPVISISYDRKNDALLDAFSLGKYCQAIDNVKLDRLMEQFLDLIKESAGIEENLRHKIASWRLLLEQQYKAVFTDI